MKTPQQEVNEYLDGDGPFPTFRAMPLHHFTETYSAALSLLDMESKEHRDKLLLSIWQLSERGSKGQKFEHLDAYKKGFNDGWAKRGIENDSLTARMEMEWDSVSTPEPKTSEVVPFQDRWAWLKSLICWIGIHRWQDGWDEENRCKSHSCQWCGVTAKFDPNTGHTHLV